MAFRWVCPFCNFAQAVAHGFEWHMHHHIDIADNAKGDVGVLAQAIACANEECRELHVWVGVVQDRKELGQYGGRWEYNENEPILAKHSLIPEGDAKPQPDYIPAPIREDYIEACLIVDLSPKASATLARRCLQGMLRDFCSVKPGRLVDEIDALAKSLEDGTAPRGVSDDSIGAITALRHMGNFGAHMEKDVDLVIPVEANEARELIGLIETLFEDWYIERHKRSQRFGRITTIAADKKKLASELKAQKALKSTD